MIEAIASLLSKTFDAWLKINSAEARKRRFAKDVYQVYNNLIEAADSLQNIEQALEPAARGERDVSFSFLEIEIARFSEAIHKIAYILQAESMDLFQLSHQPDKLKVLGIHEPALVDVFVKAWFLDGGFVEALRRLGLQQEVNGKVLKLVDASFDPSQRQFGYAIEPTVTEYSLQNHDQVELLIETCERCRRAVQEARDAARQFLSTRTSIEDLL